MSTGFMNRGLSFTATVAKKIAVFSNAMSYNLIEKYVSQKTAAIVFMSDYRL